MVNFRTYARELGVGGLSGWKLHTVNCISQNGKVLVGYGTSTRGQKEAFRLELP